MLYSIYCYPEVFEFSQPGADDSQQYVLFPDISMFEWKYRWKFSFALDKDWCSYSHVVLSLHLCQRNPITRHQVKELFQKWTGKQSSRRKFILPLIHGVA